MAASAPAADNGAGVGGANAAAMTPEADSRREVEEATLLATDAAVLLGGPVGGLASLFFFLPSLALFVRRLHDVGRSGWWILIAFTGIGVFVLLYWLIKASDAGANKYGEGPARA